MPYAIWCTTCPKPTIIGQGVRFNAEKKKVGNYYSTPIFSFRMRHVVCGGWIEIRTDPKNTAYVVAGGAQKRDTGDDKAHEGEIRIRTDEERERLQNDAFAALEVKIDDRKQAATDKGRIEELLESKEKDWEDPYAANVKIRRTFRAERKMREKHSVLAEELKDRMSLCMDILDETDEDRRRAGFVEFGDVRAGNELAIIKAQARPLFSLGSSGSTTAETSLTNPKILKPARINRVRKERLQNELKENTRAAIDPFLVERTETSPSVAVKSLKRKRKISTTTIPRQDEIRPVLEKSKAQLVDYESD